VSCPTASANLVTRRGATWQVTFAYTDEDGAVVPLTGYKARGQVRTGDSRDLLVMDMSTEGGSPRLIIDGPAGTLKINVSAADSVNLSADLLNPRELVYGVELYDDLVSPEYVEDFIAGRLTVLPEIVR
jgi:hypothetical protein